jgi:hypothetical protein
VLMHEFVAFDSLMGWRFTSDLWRLLKSNLA